MPYIIENLEQYDVTEDEAAILRAFGFVWPAEDADNPGVELDTGEYVLTPLVWETLGLEAQQAYDLFDAVLGRETTVLA